MKDLTSEKQGRSSTIQDKSGKCLTEEKQILSRWTEYCSELYNYESCGDHTVLDCSQPPEEDLQPILREEVEIAVASLKKGKSAGVDNIPAELVQAGGEYHNFSLLLKTSDEFVKYCQFTFFYSHFRRRTDSRRAVVSFWPKYGHLVLVNRV